MLITTATAPTMRYQTADLVDNEPAPPAAPVDRWETASQVAGGTLLGAGVGWLGVEAGGRAGMLIGMMLTPEGAGLPALIGNTLEGARIGIIAGGLLGVAAGVTLGVVVGSELYRVYKESQQQG